MTTASVAGVKASVGVGNGITFQMTATGTAANGNIINVVQGAAGSASTATLAAGTYTITIGANADGTSLAGNRGDLALQINNAFAAGTGTLAAPVGAIAGITATVPSNPTSAIAVTGVTTTGVLAGGVTEALGVTP